MPSLDSGNRQTRARANYGNVKGCCCGNAAVVVEEEQQYTTCNKYLPQ
jgi:hypothetical protein